MPHSQVNHDMDEDPPDQPTENLWKIIKRWMDGHKSSNKAELPEFLWQEWHKVPQLQCRITSGEHAKTHESCDWK